MRWLLALLLSLIASPTWAQPKPHTQATLHLSHSAAAPGSTITAALHLKMDPNWHTYWQNPGDSGKATKITWDLPAGITAGEIQWPVPERIELDGLFTYVYHHEAALLIPITIAPNTPAGPITLKGKASWLECEKLCIPGSAQIQATLSIGSQATPSAENPRFAEWQSKIPKPATPADQIQLTAQWDGPATAEARPIVFTINKTSGAWDFFNHPIEDFDLSPKTDLLPASEGKIMFRKVAKKYGDSWPKEITGLALVPGDEKSARVVTVSLSEPGGTIAAAPTTATTTSTSQSTTAVEKPKSLLAILGAAFLGGLILNIMPCVLPVIALKILGFVRQANENPRRVRQLGLIYALGVLCSFLVLAGIVIAIQQAGKSASWGMQFQNPQFLIFLTVLVTLVSLNLFGLFEITLSGSAMNAAGGLASREGASGTFFNGVLATILATPCTAPFLGVALGFAFLSGSPALILAIFTTVALGLAFPYVLLCWFPAWLKKLPKPGPWMEKFKIAMGFPMLATAIWLFSLAAPRFGKSGALYLGLFLTILGFAAWIFGEFVQRGTKRRGLASGFSIALLLFAFLYLLEGQLNWRNPARAAATTAIASPTNPNAIAWQSWTPAAVQAERAKGNPVLVDFTADWCLTCKVNKKTLETASVREKLKSLGVTVMIADNTDPNPAIDAELAKYQRAGVPLVLLFPADTNAPPIVFPEIIFPEMVLEALQKATTPGPIAASK